MTSAKRKRVCIVGAAASGLPAIKTCLEYGFEPVCYEKTSDIGGLWRYKPQPCDGEASVMKSTTINTSKEMTAYSDFVPPAEFANFMHNREMLEYLRLYADQFDLIRHVRFESLVTDVSRAGDFDASGRWLVTIRSKDGHQLEELFDAVMLASGHHVDPYYPPPFKGQENFKGKIMHSHSYKDSRGFEDKRVVVVGIGNSEIFCNRLIASLLPFSNPIGGDIAVELSKITSQVFLVMRSGSWLLSRIGPRGYPLDVVYNTRLFSFFLQHLPLNWSCSVAENEVSKKVDHELYAIKPKHRLFQAHPTVNDELPNRICCGTVQVKPQISEMTEKDVLFEDGSGASDVDVLILSTGYSFAFPYLESGRLVAVAENRVSLYKYMFPPQLDRATLCVLGLIQPYGSIMPIVEMQARLFCDVLVGRTDLPSRDEMLRDIGRLEEQMGRRYVAKRRHTIQVDLADYMDQLADMMACKPAIWPRLFSDPRLFRALLFGPLAAYQFRLDGPHPWCGARHALLTVRERVEQPLRKGKFGRRTEDRAGYALLLVFLLVLAVYFGFRR